MLMLPVILMSAWFPRGADCRAVGLSLLFADAAAETWPKGQIPVGAGTAVAGDGHVLTAAHVIAGCRRISVVRDGLARPATLVGMDTRLDVALLDDSTPAPASHAPSAADAAAPSPLANSLAAGSETGRADATRVVHVVGFGQAGNRSTQPVSMAAKTDGYVQDVTQQPLLSLSGKLQPGTSGSPVLMPDGRSLGMVVGRLRVDPSRNLALRNTEMLRFISCFDLDPSPGRSGVEPVLAVMVQCPN